VSRIALVHDWLTGMRGGEKVLEALCDLYPEAPIYTLLHVKGSVSKKIESHRIIPSYLQHVPMIGTMYRNYLPFFPAAIESFNLREYDLIISSSHCVAKGAIPGASSIHVCYCHTPMRYVWSHFKDYFGRHRTSWLKHQLMVRVAAKMRSWDVAVSDRVHSFAANSFCVATRIKNYYGRQARIIYPPVETDFYVPSDLERQDFYLLVSALVPYKHVEIAIEAFNRMKKRLVIVGTGPEISRLQRIASSQIQFLGRVEAEKLRELYQTARALIQPGEEDFGINMIEAMACSCPVIAYAFGGAYETVTDPETGLFFNQLTPEALSAKVDKAEGLRFNNALMRNTSLRFSLEHFKDEFQALVQTEFHS
jgi:glycosyltransferase involved in cell wall biosynthesis